MDKATRKCCEVVDCGVLKRMLLRLYVHVFISTHAVQYLFCDDQSTFRERSPTSRRFQYFNEIYSRQSTVDVWCRMGWGFE